jgi:hypothetical protein
MIRPVPRPHRRGASRSSRTLGAGCDGRAWCTDECARRGRRSRVVLAPRRWREVGDNAPHCAGDGDNKPDRRRERGISRKTIARGMPGCFGLPVVTNSCALLLSHARLRVWLNTRHSLRPPFSEGWLDKARAFGAAGTQSHGYRHTVGPAGGRSRKNGKCPLIHHILHKYQGSTATAWPFRRDMVFRKHSFDRHD